MSNEAEARLKINKLLEESDWVLEGADKNISVENSITLNDGNRGSIDYVLYNSFGKPLAIIEAKAINKDPLIGKEQARNYSKVLGNQYIILTNSITHYLWDLNGGNPTEIYKIPSQKNLELQDSFKPNKQLLIDKKIEEDFIALSQRPQYKSEPDYLNPNKRGEFIRSNKLVFLRPYQLEAIKSIQKSISNGNQRFLFEMATGTGKTKTTAGVIKLFLSTSNAKRVLFLVDRIELEDQAKSAFEESLKPTYSTVIWKENRQDWRRADIVISTIQSFTKHNKYKREFLPNDFDLVISDEAHRSIGGNARKVFEYFIGYKLGLTATPKEYLKNIGNSSQNITDPKELERRLLMDTYNTFGCESGEPTYRYSLTDGVKDGFLINPLVVDARTEITTKLLSDEGFHLNDKDEDGNDIEEAFGIRDFEKKFFSDNTNEIFCQTFLNNALIDPIIGEIGKTLIFCVSQKHATKITNILNKIASEIYPNKYNSDFAVQITSSIPEAQSFTTQFTYNKLNGESQANPNYRTSKTRICVTCSMMTTGYDCEDVLNVCLMKPVFSPSDFIQMKGRGTRKHNFFSNWIDKTNLPLISEPNKTKFKLFDFFGNCEYFEEKFDYDEILKLPKGNGITTKEGPISITPDYEFKGLDPLASIKEIVVGFDGMRIDREAFGKFTNLISNDTKIKKLTDDRDWESLEDYMVKNIFDKPNDYFNLEKFRQSLGIDRRISVRELVEFTLGKIPFIKSKNQLIDEEFERFEDRFELSSEEYAFIKDFFNAYIIDKDLQQIIDKKEFSKLNTHTIYESFKKVPKDFKTIIPDYIKNYIPLNKFA